ncbi:MAG: hypothetical protein ACUZ8H_16485 [Candidatus Anammoxibacter sp.]
MPLLIIVGILGYLFYKSGTNLVSGLKYRFKSLSLIKGGTDIFSVRLRTILIVENPTAGSASFDRIEGSANIKGVNVGDFLVSGGIRINPNSFIEVPVTIKIRNFTIIPALIEAFRSRTIPVVNLTGTIFTSLGNITFSQNVN